MAYEDQFEERFCYHCRELLKDHDDLTTAQKNNPDSLPERYANQLLWLREVAEPMDEEDEDAVMAHCPSCALTCNCVALDFETLKPLTEVL